MLLRLKAKPIPYLVESQKFTSFRFARNVWIKMEEKEALTKIEAKIDTGAAISTLIYTDIEKVVQVRINNIKPEFNPFSPGGNVKGDLAFIFIRFDSNKQDEYIKIPAWLVKRNKNEPGNNRLLLGWMGFLEKHNLLIVPGLEDHSILYNKKDGEI